MGERTGLQIKAPLVSDVSRHLGNKIRLWIDRGVADWCQDLPASSVLSTCE